MAKLLPVSPGCHDQTRRGDVIFVHGLNGNAVDYWCHEGKQENFWPAWLGQDLPNVGVWSLGYENAAFKSRGFSILNRFGCRGFAMPLEDRAENVLLELSLDGIGTRPLVFITHSMGGLLVKRLLHTANDSHDPKWRAILEQTRGVCFIATPHIGSDLARWASYFRILLGTNVSVKQLQPHDHNLRQLKKWYSDLVTGRRADIKTLSFYEMKPLPRRWFRVVAPGDADPGVPLTGNYPLDEDHSSICTPSSQHETLYKKILEFLEVDVTWPRRDPLSPVPAEEMRGQGELLVRNTNRCPGRREACDAGVAGIKPRRLGPHDRGNSGRLSKPGDEHAEIEVAFGA